ncbi:MAG TPA: hypothetical protein VG963_24690 [Polyangiaceae bacterium]|nr:hypothetical protein [Polyangiaceae bacterium]
MRRPLLLLLGTITSVAAWADEAYFLREVRTGGLTKHCVYQYVEPYILTIPAHQRCPQSIDTDALTEPERRSERRPGGGYTGAEFSLGFVEGFNRRTKERKQQAIEEEERARRRAREDADARWQQELRERQRKEWAEKDALRAQQPTSSPWVVEDLDEPTVEGPLSAVVAISSAERLLQDGQLTEARTVAYRGLRDPDITPAQRRDLHDLVDESLRDQ